MKRSSNATFLGDTVCRGETLPWFEVAAEPPLTTLVGDMLVIVMCGIDSMGLNGGMSSEGSLMGNGVVCDGRVSVELVRKGWNPEPESAVDGRDEGYQRRASRNLSRMSNGMRYQSTEISNIDVISSVLGCRAVSARRGDLTKDAAGANGRRGWWLRKGVRGGLESRAWTAKD